MNFLITLLASLSDANEEVKKVVTLIKNIAVTVFGLAGVAVAGLAVYLAFKFFTATDEGKRKNAKNQLIYAIIGLALLIAMLVLVTPISDAINKAITGNTAGSI